MEFKLIRDKRGSGCVMGKLYHADKYKGTQFRAICDTIEPMHDVTHPCIPAGKYKLGWHESPKFNAMRPILLDVKGRKYILIHEGNKPADTQGCILVGNYYSACYITSSKATLDVIMSMLITARGFNNTIEIVDA